MTPPCHDLRSRAGGTLPAQAMLRAPWDGLLEDLLGEQRWDQYAADERRGEVAAELTDAHAP